jgi:hypothetical protein
MQQLHISTVATSWHLGCIWWCIWCSCCCCCCCCLRDSTKLASSALLRGVPAQDQQGRGPGSTWPDNWFWGLHTFCKQVGKG